MPRIRPTTESIRQPAREAPFGPLGSVCRLGLATRGNTSLSADAVLHAVERGVNFLNWCGHSDGMSRAVREMGKQRRDVVVAVQFDARDGEAARCELDQIKQELNTSYLDVVTYYYVEHPDEWQRITAASGAADVLEAARADGEVRMIGLTSHQRPLAAQIAAGGRLDMLMIRYNAAHRGAEEDVFPVIVPRDMPVVTYTALRWGALMKSTPDDPAEFQPPPAPDWYRFALCHQAISVCVAAPDGDAELEKDLALLDDWRGFDERTYAALCAHGGRVRRHGGGFP